MMRRNLSFRMIAGESGRSRVMDLPTLRTAGLLPSMAYPAEKCIPSPGTTRATSGFQENRGLSHLRDGRLVEQFPWSALGRRNKPGSTLLNRADCGSHSGAAGACRISRMARSARRTQPLMVWQGACLRPATRSHGRVWVATQEGRPEPDKRWSHRHAHEQKRIALQHRSLDDGGRRSVVVVVHGLRHGTHRPDRTRRVDRRPEAHD